MGCRSCLEWLFSGIIPRSEVSFMGVSFKYLSRYPFPNIYPVIIVVLCVICITNQHTIAQQKPTAQLFSSSRADTWTATDDLGRSVATHEVTGNIRKDRFVGIFYFIWQGAHGYDKHNSGNETESVMQKNIGDTASPYDISVMLKTNPNNPQYGPLHAFHYWGQPYFGYYLPDDEWIIRKHAQMLSDAGIDVIVLDVTNASIYLPQVTKIANVYRAMREKGLSTPQIAFIVNSVPERTVKRLYESIYKKQLFSDLWFYWKGKPLLLCPPEAVTPEIATFFTTRQSWAWSNKEGWFGDGKDKWTWLDNTPQAYGWHTSPDKSEQISVNIAQHPATNIGRSFHNGIQPDAAHFRSAEGINFADQWKRALEVDPEFVFITGWNEWVAMRFAANESSTFLGKPIKKGDTYFVDLYNEEYSRDAEPLRGGFGDNYYYQMIDGIRRYKGTRPLPVTAASTTVKIDGSFTDWKNVTPAFDDDEGDTFHRNHPGWGRIQQYINSTGRNDIVTARVVVNKKHISFYVKTAAPLTSWKDSAWMNLFIQVKDADIPDWKGFQYLVNRQAINVNTTTLEQCTGGWNWKKTGEIRYAVKGNEMELQLPLEYLGITEKQGFEINFKWADNAPLDGDVLHWLDKGDAAPNARFCYRYIYKP
jgi:hypothetical protein